MAANPFVVDVHVQYLPQQSLPQQGLYRFAYTITITNTGDCTAQVLARRWLVRNDRGVPIQEVRGLGVAGRQPVLEPGEAHTYTSGCELPTPQGQMEGHFVGITEEAQVFECPIAAFTLDVDALPQQFASSSRGGQTLH
jgi:ApaG protein